MSRIWLRAIQGACLSVGAPLGWLSLQAISGQPAWDDLHEAPFLYLYMLLSTMVAFAVLGSLLGHHEDGLLKANKLLDELSVTDAVTGLKNQRYFLARFAEEFSKANRNSFPLSIAVVGLDGFKLVEERYGYELGDQLLAAAATAIASIMRKEETVARVGPDEFALILPQSNGPKAKVVADRLRQAVNAALVPGSGDKEVVKITVCVGIAATPEANVSTPKELYLRAEAALREAKAHGTGKIHLSQQ